MFDELNGSEREKLQLNEQTKTILACQRRNTRIARES
jgi:hypothetical protein